MLITDNSIGFELGKQNKGGHWKEPRQGSKYDMDN